MQPDDVPSALWKTCPKSVATIALSTLRPSDVDDVDGAIVITLVIHHYASTSNK